MDLISHLHWLAKQQKFTKKLPTKTWKKTSVHKLVFGQNLGSAFLSTGSGNPFIDTTKLNHPYYQSQENSRLKAWRRTMCLLDQNTSRF